MSGYVLDDLALSAGLAGAGSEHHRRELSRLLRGAIDGGPRLDVPAMCLAAAATLRPAIAGYLADILAAAPPDAINVSALARTTALDALRAAHPGLDWPGTHAATQALAARLPVLTVDSGRYRGVSIDILSL
jgi:hypothetical protein